MLIDTNPLLRPVSSQAAGCMCCRSVPFFPGALPEAGGSRCPRPSGVSLRALRRQGCEGPALPLLRPWGPRSTASLRHPKSLSAFGSGFSREKVRIVATGRRSRTGCCSLVVVQVRHQLKPQLGSNRQARGLFLAFLFPPL